MIIKGYIAVNEMTNEVLMRDDDGDNFRYVFTTVHELCDYIANQKLKISDYIVHRIEGEVFEIVATTRGIG